jgi:DNA (cytosine-5)-methyltransferase 1
MAERFRSDGKFVDLFAGIGGFRLALEGFGLRCVFSSEIDRNAQKTYSENFGDVPSGDIREYASDEIPLHNVLCAGFPCQAFSIAGKMRGFQDKTKGTLFHEVARIADDRKPEVVFMENVSNFEVHDHGRTLETVISTMDRIGYDTFHEVLDSARYGAPTARSRIYFVAFRKSLGIKSFAFPMPTDSPVRLRDFVLPDSETDGYLVKREMMPYVKIEPSSDVFGEESSYNQPVRIGTISYGGQGDRIYSDLGPAVTLTSGSGGAGGKTGCYLINGRVRRLAPRECARVMTFPDSFRIPVSVTQAQKQFGNSVVVKVVSLVFCEVMRTLENITL